jgi:hypothetical protein
LDPRETLQREAYRDDRDESQADQPGMAELRLRQDDAENATARHTTTGQHSIDRHTAHLRTDDDKPSATGHECGEEAPPSERKEPSIDPRA